MPAKFAGALRVLGVIELGGEFIGPIQEKWCLPRTGTLLELEPKQQGPCAQRCIRIPGRAVAAQGASGHRGCRLGIGEREGPSQGQLELGLELALPGWFFLGAAIAVLLMGLALLLGLWTGGLPMALVVTAILTGLAWLVLRRIFGANRGEVTIWDRDINDN